MAKLRLFIARQLSPLFSLFARLHGGTIHRLSITYSVHMTAATYRVSFHIVFLLHLYIFSFCIRLDRLSVNG